MGKSTVGSDLAVKAGSALSDIVDKVTQVTDLVTGISKASSEQTDGLGKVSEAVTRVDTITQQNASAAEESATAAEQLNAQAGAPRDIIKELVNLVYGAGYKETER